MHCGAKQQSNLNNALWSKSKNALWSKATIKSQQCTVEQSKGATEEQNKNSLWSKVTIKSNNVEQSMRAQSSKRGDAFKSGSAGVRGPAKVEDQQRECTSGNQLQERFLQTNLNNVLWSKSNNQIEQCTVEQTMRQKWRTWGQRRECTNGNRF